MTGVRNMGINVLISTKRVYPLPGSNMGRGKSMLTTQQRLDKYTDKLDNGCWEWFGNLDTKGYGQITIDKRKFSTHRVSYTLNKGEIKNNLYVLHTCDNPKCLNPEHLFLGTQKDNIHDMISKNRNSPPPRRDTPQEIVDLIKADLSNDSLVKLGRKYGVSPTVVFRIRGGPSSNLGDTSNNYIKGWIARKAT